MKQWQGMIVVITGASSGIGENIAHGVAKQGATPVLLARSYEKLMILKEQIQEEAGVTAIAYALDVTEESSVFNVFSKIKNEVGRVDVLINNAGFGVFEAAHET